jgi:hypothetical protein
MEKLRKEQLWQPLVTRLNDYASEFSGGRLTGPLLKMADIGFLLFLVALRLTFFFRRVAAGIALGYCFPSDFICTS